ncbi:M4 family metallopeptidase [Streptomyces sp. A73]|uniref:M4 family metallopeptidase n=1 Tax=Streptomyces sp. B15 TaxID=1537797 RepID=UPI000C180690|nr:M4 family metallopeptidase [Streptomyces sp. B15]MBQ1123240.1 M4 family metallopeptidase [Streptomyces sp. B15]MBQ1162202.1 M4 family metallopeptidase [Streptomyces sp. A73]
MRRSTSHGNPATSHRRRPARLPHPRASAGIALGAVAALLSVAVQSGPATADDQDRATARTTAAKGADSGALPADLSPTQRAALLRKADSKKAATAEKLGLGAKEKLVVRDVLKDRDGTVHTRYERTYDGLPVLGGDMIVETTKKGSTEEVVRASKHALKNVPAKASVRPGTAERQALKAADAAGSEKTDADRAPRKVVWLAKGKPTLAYETVVGGLQDDGTPNELHVVTDARSGKKLYQWQAVQNGIGNTQYSGQVTLSTARSGSNYTLTDNDRGGHRTYNLNRGTSGTGSLFSQSSDTWGNGSPSNAATAGADAHYGAAETWDYYKDVFGRSGIRGDGRGAYSRVHYGNNYVNAFWSDSCFCMTYGDGSGNSKPLTSMDVAAHEMTHGLTSATAGLIYSGESGGLNEATSDILATAVEFHAANSADKGDYLIGEKIDIRGNGTPLRYQDKPSRDGASKDNWYAGIGNIDVHYSSGPANHWFYLLSEGSGAKVINGVSYDSPTADGLPVTGIGREKAALIWYKALTTKFTSTTNYASARTGTLAVAGELYGTDSAEYKAVADAWAGVAVGARSGGGDPGDGKTFTNDADVSIPDYPGAAVTSKITTSGLTGRAPSNLKVGVNIVHTYSGDLQIDLIGPSGRSYRLHNVAADPTPNIDTTYTVDASAENANGVWQLRVRDRGPADTGHINSFKLTFP